MQPTPYKNSNFKQRNCSHYKLIKASDTRAGPGDTRETVMVIIHFESI